MNLSVLSAAAMLTGALAGVAAAQSYEVSRERQLSADATEVWHVVGDFCDIDDWHPDVRACELKVIEGRLFRLLTLGDGTELAEQRIASEPGLSYTYRFTESPLPIDRFTATLSVTPGDGTRLTWSARFTSGDPGMEALVGDFFEAGLSAIEGRLPPD